MVGWPNCAFCASLYGWYDSHVPPTWPLVEMGSLNFLLGLASNCDRLNLCLLSS
jgi:hypothetical protein